VLGRTSMCPDGNSFRRFVGEKTFNRICPAVKRTQPASRPVHEGRYLNKAGTRPKTMAERKVLDDEPHFCRSGQLKNLWSNCSLIGE
jgi:hypothetical protein